MGVNFIVYNFMLTLFARERYNFVVLSFTVHYSSFYRAMHFNAKRGIAIACCLSVCPFVSVTLVNCDHIGWNSSK